MMRVFLFHHPTLRGEELNKTHGVRKRIDNQELFSIQMVVIDDMMVWHGW
jgi:hypothetical protein